MASRPRPPPPPFNPFDDDPPSRTTSYNPFDSSDDHTCGDENAPPTPSFSAPPPSNRRFTPPRSQSQKLAVTAAASSPAVAASPAIRSPTTKDAKALLFDNSDGYTASVDLLPDLQRGDVEVEEDYALRLSEETTKTVHSCVKIAEDIKAEATRTVINLHEQGEKMFHTHRVVSVEMDRNLTAGEKLLGSLGGIFSRSWRPRRSPSLRGPMVESSTYHVQRKETFHEQRSADLRGHGNGLHYSPSSHCDSRPAAGIMQTERRKQDDAFADLSNILDQLKDMSTDMGHEISRQNASLDNFLSDTSIMEDRVKSANAWGKRLLGRR